jgi:hypothetical protein
LTVTQIELRTVQFPTTISDTKSLNTSLLEVIIPSINARVFIRDLSDLTLHIIIDAWWASINIGSKRPIGWKNSRHLPAWRFYVDCGIEESGSPVMISIICHQVFRHPSEYETSSMGKHVLPKARIAKVNKLTVPEVTKLTSSTVAETALPILRWQRCRGILIVSLKRKIQFTIPVLTILTELTDRTLQTGGKGFSNC